MMNHDDLQQGRGTMETVLVEEYPGNTEQMDLRAQGELVLERQGEEIPENLNNWEEGSQIRWNLNRSLQEHMGGA